MVITRENNNLVIQIPDVVDINEIQRFLNYLGYKENTSTSQATQEQVDDLAREINKNWWERNKHRFETE